MEKSDRVGELNKKYDWKGMERERQPYWIAFLIVGAILTPIGAFFLAITYRFPPTAMIFGICLSGGLVMLVFGCRGWKKSDYDFGAESIKRKASNRLWLKSWTVSRLHRVCKIGEVAIYAFGISLVASIVTGASFSIVNTHSWFIGVWVGLSLIGGGATLAVFLLPWVDQETLKAQGEAIEQNLVEKQAL